MAKFERLGWWLVFCVVYADIGTSVFYVPGILWGRIGALAMLAQVITLGVFVSIARKYVAISARCPDGGGVVSITHQAFPNVPTLSLVGGSMITIDYFLTSAISGVSAIYYLETIAPFDKSLTVPITIGILFLLLLLNVIGLKESASVTAVFAVAALTLGFLLAMLSASYITLQHQWGAFFEHITRPEGAKLTVTALLIGYADTWLAYSGLESGAQIAGSMRNPVRETASRGMWMVIATVAAISPWMAGFCTFLLPDAVKAANTESFIAQLANQLAGPALMALTVITATALLIMACNTAIVGNYHVNLRLVGSGFLPPGLGSRNRRFGTPHLSIIISAAVPMIILLVTGGDVTQLGDLYAFGLLGSLTLSSISLDLIHWRERKRGPRFWVGVLTTLALATAFAINLVHKRTALYFGGGLTLLLVALGTAYQRGWLARLLPAEKRRARPPILTPEAIEAAAAGAPAAQKLLTVEEAVALRPLESSKLMVAIRGPSTRLIEDAALVARGLGEHAVYLIFVEEVPGLFFAPEAGPSEEANEVLQQGVAELQRLGLAGIPLWRISPDAAAAIVDAARRLGVKAVMVGTSKRSAVWRLVRGQVLKGLMESLPEEIRLFISN